MLVLARAGRPSRGVRVAGRATSIHPLVNSVKTQSESESIMSTVFRIEPVAESPGPVWVEVDDPDTAVDRWLYLMNHFTGSPVPTEMVLTAQHDHDHYWAVHDSNGDCVNHIAVVRYDQTDPEPQPARVLVVPAAPAELVAEG